MKSYSDNSTDVEHLRDRNHELVRYAEIFAQTIQRLLAQSNLPPEFFLQEVTATDSAFGPHACAWYEQHCLSKKGVEIGIRDQITQNRIDAMRKSYAPHIPPAYVSAISPEEIAAWVNNKSE